MSVDAGSEAAQEQPRQSLSTAAARNLATTTKTVPQMQGITSRWLLRMLPWVQVSGGTYRVNRRLAYQVGGGRVAVAQTADQATVVPPSLREVPLLAGLDDEAVLAALAAAFTQQDVAAGTVIAGRGQPADTFYVIAHGKVSRAGDGAFGQDAALGVVADGGYFGADGLAAETTWDRDAVALTDVTLLGLPRAQFQAIVGQSPGLQAQVTQYQQNAAKPQNKRGEADIAITAGHSGEPPLDGTFADYELAPREYELSVAQTVLRVHSRVADLFNDPMNQVQQQLRLTVEALRERQEHEMVNNPDFGLLHNAAYAQQIQTHSGPPTPDDLDELLSRRRSTKMMFAHPQGDRGVRPRMQQTRRLPQQHAGAGGRGFRLARRADLLLQQDPRHRRADHLHHRDADRRRRPGRRRPAPDRHPGRARARPERPLHGHRRQGHHLLPGQRLLLRRRPGPRRPRHPAERRSRPPVQLIAAELGLPAAGSGLAAAGSGLAAAGSGLAATCEELP